MLPENDYIRVRIGRRNSFRQRHGSYINFTRAGEQQGFEEGDQRAQESVKEHGLYYRVQSGQRYRRDRAPSKRR